MNRLLYLSFVALVASPLPVQAQKNDPPKYVTNSLGMKFVWIRPGTFIMGSPKEEKNRHPCEVQHTVKLTRGFYMGVYAVTQEQWRDVIYTPDFVRPAEGFDLANPSRFRHDKNPVDTVSWDDCQVFIKKLRQIDKQLYRLPTEAEWEYACRAGTTTPFHFAESSVAPQANYGGEWVVEPGKKGATRRTTMPVGSFAPNAWGLYDMHGNVAQWCQDRFGPYPSRSTTDPRGPDEGGSRVLRGGSWQEAPARCRSAARAWDSPNNRGKGTFGLRVCFSLE